MSIHKPVLLKEVIEFLDPKKGKIFVDCTLGGGGHAEAMIAKVGKEGRVIGLDFDKSNIEKLAKQKRIETIWANFKDIKKVLHKKEIETSSKIVGRVDGILADLGFSSDQLEKVPGLSFQKDEYLDMRLDKSGDLTATDILNKFSQKEIAEILSKYGEERKADLIAEKIVRQRKTQEIETAFQLVQIVQSCYPEKIKVRGVNVATKTFMALRIAVNGELENLEQFLAEAMGCLKKGGKIAIISFHSLEDRIVKNFFKREAKKCICDEDQAQCTCNHQPILKIITKKPIVSSAEERQTNPRSRSAKLRIAEKI
ncbi:MAG: 16S rRNA (cytosine(1402)-N(4))-methyltransferase RsmH [Patescibacteria group bacterium]|nr:16S rRNA (cytosine(1402)-N(4))-methyltransferase RsmH [Patescibacteria group bacterium]